MGDLQGAPGESNVRDLTGARTSYSRAETILERETVSQPHNAQLRHLLTSAYVREAQLKEYALPVTIFGSAIHTFSSSWEELGQLQVPPNTSLDRAEQSA